MRQDLDIQIALLDLHGNSGEDNVGVVAIADLWMLGYTAVCVVGVAGRRPVFAHKGVGSLDWTCLLLLFGHIEAPVSISDWLAGKHSAGEVMR